MRDAPRLGVVAVVVIALLAGIGLFARWVNRDRARRSSSLATAPGPAPTATTTTVPAAARRLPVWRDEADGDRRSEDLAYKRDPLSPLVDTAEAWSRVDFDAIRRALPDSQYWTMAFPTKDPALLAERDRVRAEWNVQFGKIQSNTATPEEIDAYYAQQEQLSNDYLEFLFYLAEHYGDVVPRSEVGALKLAGELHLARLEEIPRKIAEAKERHAAHERARQRWLAEQQQFGPSGSGR